jgi:hypothetical protein
MVTADASVYLALLPEYGVRCCPSARIRDVNGGCAIILTLGFIAVLMIYNFAM